LKKAGREFRAGSVIFIANKPKPTPEPIIIYTNLYEIKLKNIVL